MKTLDDIRLQLSLGDFEFSRHAFHRAVERNISAQEIQESGIRAEIIEDYPDDKYSPSILLLGFTLLDRALHLQVSLAYGSLARIITVYEPSSLEWTDDRHRRLS